MLNRYQYTGEMFLSWEDADGDEIAIKTDEHLAIALDDLPGPVYKFKARIHILAQLLCRIL